MMSQHGYQPSFRNHLHTDGTMDLYIETLTGTAFEMTVSPFDTVMSIKSKIQRVEGIPVSHQHLLYNMHELNDSACLIDYSIQDGATLKLVLSMRGGPISTRRLPLGEELAWKEQLRELVEGSRDDVRGERLPPNARVTVFVFGEGNQLNLVRVIENDDGSYTPLSESWSGSSIRNLFAEEDPDEATKRLQENSVTMGKMQELQQKMETLTMHKKPKTNSSEVLSPTRPLLSHRGISRTHNSNSPKLTEPLRINSHTNLLQLPLLNTCDPSSSSRFHSSDNYLGNSSLLQTDQPVRTKEYRLSRREAKPELSGRRPGRASSLLPDIKPNRSEHLVKIPREHKNPASEESVLLTPAITITQEENNSFSDHPPIAVPSNEASSITVSQIAHNRVVTKVGNSGRYRLSRFVLKDSEDRPKTSPDNLTKQQKAAQEICDVLSETKWHRHTRQPRVPCSMETQLDFGQVDFVHKERTVEDSDLDVTVRSPRYGRRSLLLPAVGSDRTQEKPVQETYKPSMLSDEEKEVPRERKPSDDPPPNPELREPSTGALPKKPSTVRIRCAQCKKRLNITNMYTCRCNQLFCSAHRHCESHQCSFDYKTHGRKLLQAANPVVSAPKLPKI